MKSYDRAKNGPLCLYYMHGKCNKGTKCRLFHPPKSLLESLNVQKEFKREPGMCYCGSYMRTVLNRNPIRRSDDDRPTFFMVCAKTGKSMYKCKK